ncbi:protein of unknown function (plasmid) [Cupriavidus taiwanensis]|uniref:Uncharacterized protein n=1 Tax=Cupriavidus taiwanensis TaxID=164546 RepID=A0A9Q7V264_9BURK|nr:protein of unknown function [Cupriavidus taiwanensis]
MAAQCGLSQPRSRHARPLHAVPPPRRQQPARLGAVPGHHDVRRPDRRGRGRAHRRQRARPRRELHRYRRRVQQGRVRADGRAPAHRQPPRLGAGHQAWQRHAGGAQPRPLLAHVDHARGRGQPAPAGDRLHRHPLPASRLSRRQPGRGGARHGRPGAQRQDPLLGGVELPRLAHRRDRAAVRRAGRAASGGVPAVLQPAEPAARGRDPARVRALRPGCGALQPGRARRADRQVRARPGAGRRHARGPRRPPHDGDRVPRGIAGHRPAAQDPCRGARADSRPVRHGLGAGQPDRVVGDRRPAHAGSVRGLLRRARCRDHARGRGDDRCAGVAGPCLYAGLQRSGLSADRAAREARGGWPIIRPRLSDALQVALALPGVTSVHNGTRPAREHDAPGRDSY